MKKRLLKIKWENILLMLFIPLAIIQFLKAHIDFKLISVLMSLTLYGGFCIVVQMSRKEALLNVKDEVEKPLLKPILNYMYSYVYGFKSIKKRDYQTSKIYKRPSLYIKSKF